MKIPYLPLRELNARFNLKDQQSFEDVYDSGRYIGGPFVERFEHQFANYCGVDNVVSTGNGLDALTVILLAEKELGNLPQNAKILLPAHTYIATFLSIIHAGMQPVPVDVTDILLTVNDLQAQIHKVDAIITVDLYGKLVDDEVYAFAEAQQKPVYCDSAQSHGAINVNGKRSGSIARASAFSFYPTKNLGALGDGGAITTNDHLLAAMSRKLANYGRDNRFQNSVKGVNSRLDPLQAAFLSNRLTSLDQDNKQRFTVAQFYFNHIKNDHVVLANDGFLMHNSWHVFPVFVADREHFQSYLSNHGIETNVHYPVPPHQQEAFKELNDLSFPHTEKLHNTEVSLPCHPLMTSLEMEYIVKVVNNY
ncbi:DegT/DnrJ/EryC1/StrS family aminotransferase [Nonlabens arenilitoris]|uniref:DegT/DnrJ/EryC1/StrS family aminotransferase n=1 Tax=Nonlabens arenilitoris TaxID=1217969 RepID=A0A2S7U8P3_9FLAO|nr:DegT/DnrJ/EryC1/StrS family aminotransferase [Nonlabens arenilitoris]PQJ30673.1 DegT/DnrJ/EryC1/StrS family aminotransferase [Nonlabens arenilitoris]